MEMGGVIFAQIAQSTRHTRIIRVIYIIHRENSRATPAPNMVLKTDPYHF